MKHTKKLFHAIVVIGMATAACSSDSNPPMDASTDDVSNADASTKDVTTTPDATKDAVADVGDGFSGWLGC